jgi:hypothetical protein
LSPRGEAGFPCGLSQTTLLLAFLSSMSYNNDMSAPPDYQTIRIWTRTLRVVRLVAALTGERMVKVLDRLVAEELRRKHEQERRRDV